MSLFNIPGDESIAFQSSSSLAKSLTKFFQSIIDYRNNLDYSKCANDVRSQRIYRLDEVYQYCKKKKFAEFKNIVLKEVGLNIRKMFLFGGSSSDIYGFFAVNTTIDDARDAAETMGRETASDNGYYGSSREAIQEMSTMCDNLDLKTGKLTSSKFGKNREIGCSMYFDVNFAFCMDDFIVKDVTDNLTAEEIAAIMMHEIGHVITMIEHSGDMYATKSRVDTILHASKQWNPQEVAKQMKEFLIPVLKRKAIENTGSPEMNNLLKKYSLTLINGINALYEAIGMEPDDESWIITIGSLVCNIAYMLIKTILIIFFVITIFIPLLCYFFGELTKHLAVDETYTGGKASDLYTTRNNLFLFERWADDFVAKHGMGQYLASSLNKFNKVFDNYELGYVTSIRLRQSTWFSCMTKLYSVLMSFVNVMGYTDIAIYENSYNRNLRVLQNSYSIFKTKNIPGPIKDIWINNIEEIKIATEDSKKMSDTAICRAITNIFMNITNPVRWVTMLKDANMERDLAKLQNAIDDFQNNPFWYQSYKLASLK